MLNKNICKKCKNKYFFGWNKWAEEEWDKGTVFCYFYDDMRYVFIKDPPRKNCYFKLEQLLNE
jgi:hypothetical protein